MRKFFFSPFASPNAAQTYFFLFLFFFLFPACAFQPTNSPISDAMAYQTNLAVSLWRAVEKMVQEGERARRRERRREAERGYLGVVAAASIIIG